MLSTHFDTLSGWVKDTQNKWQYLRQHSILILLAKIKYKKGHF